MPSLNFGDAWPWLQWVLGVAAVVTFLGAAVRGIPAVWRFVKRFITTVDSLADLPEELVKQREFRDETKATLADQGSQLDVLKHEVFPNSGKSLRDGLDRVEVAVSEIHAKLANDDTRIVELQNRDSLGRFVKKDASDS